MARIYVSDRWVLRSVNPSLPPWHRRWRWHVRYRVSGQPLAEADRVARGWAFTATGARWAMRRWVDGADEHTCQRWRHWRITGAAMEVAHRLRLIDGYQRYDHRCGRPHCYGLLGG